MNRCLNCLAGVLFALVVASCGGGSSPPIGKTCLMNSECANPLSCTFGKCHAACVEARDCPAGQNCIKGPAGNVCQQPEESICQYRSQCASPLICAIDRKCRSQCLMDIDCPTKTQKCVQPDHVCAEPAELNADMKITNGVGMPPVPEIPDGGLDTGAGGAGGATGGAGGSTADGSVTDGAAGGAGGAGGATGGAGGGSMMPIPVSGVVVDKPIVRQGETGINATITATMGGLTGPTNIELGGAMGCRGTVQDGATDTMFVVRITCPHGTALGPKDLKFQTAKGVGTYPAAITVSAITASPMGVDTNRGTSDSPFRSFKKALGVADKGDIIDLKDGQYDKENGEDFKDPIPPGIVIQGQSAAGTKLIGPTDTSIAVDGIHLRDAGTLTVKNLTLGFFNRGIAVDKPADFTFENVKVIRSRQYGVYVYYSMGDGTKFNWTGDDSEISDHGYQAVLIYSKGSVFNYKSKGVISSTGGSVFQANGEDITVSLDGTTLTSSMMMPQAQAFSGTNAATLGQKITLNNVTFNGQSDISAKDKSVATITGCTFNLPSTSGGSALEFSGATLTLSKTVFNGGAYHLRVQSGEVTVRDTKFKDYYYYGVQVSTAKKLDLGNMTQPGNDEFTPNPTYGGTYMIYDQRAADPTPITVRDATVNSNLIPMMTYEGPGMVGPPKTFYISTAKNQIIVY